MAWEERATGVLAALALLALALAIPGPGGAPEITGYLDPGTVSEDIDATFKLTFSNEDIVDVRIYHAYIVFPWEASENLQYENVMLEVKKKSSDTSIRWTTHVTAGFGGKSYKLNIKLWVNESDGAGGWKYGQPYSIEESTFVSAPFSLTSGLGLGLIGAVVGVIIVIILAIIATRIAKKKRAQRLERKKMEEAMRERQEKMVLGADDEPGQQRRGPPGMPPGSGPQYGGGPPMGQPPMGAGPQYGAGPPMGQPPMGPGPQYGSGPPMGRSPMGPPPGSPPSGYGAPGPVPGPASSQPPTPAAPVSISCPSCKTMSDARAASCWKCGASLRK